MSTARIGLPVLELRSGRIAKTTEVYSAPFDPPTFRSAWVERHDLALPCWAQAGRCPSACTDWVTPRRSSCKWRES